MVAGTIFYVGTEQEVRHHALPLTRHVPIRIASPEEVTETASPGDLAIFFSEHFERFRNAILNLRRRHVATLYAIDGILEWRNAWGNHPNKPACPWTMRPVLCHKVACIGPSQARTLSAWGNADKVEVVGIPRFDFLQRDSHARHDSGSTIRILVMTAKCPGFTETQRQQIIESLVDVKEWFARAQAAANRKYELVWRLTGGLDKVLGINNVLSDTTGRDLASVLQRVDATITTPSTAQLESMLTGKPTVILDYTNSPLYEDAAWKITSKCQIGPVVGQLCDPPAERMHFQNCVLNDSLQLEMSATDRMLVLINTMRELASASSRRSDALQFREAILPQVRNQPEQLCRQAAFPQRDAFKIGDETTLQTELADSRREIELLSDTIDGLRAELGQAHEIFAAIHKHPIVGPVVRSRQRVINWFSETSTKGRK